MCRAVDAHTRVSWTSLSVTHLLLMCRAVDASFNAQPADVAQVHAHVLLLDAMQYIECRLHSDYMGGRAQPTADRYPI